MGSIFLHKFPPSPVAVIGPLTIHPSAEGGVGRMLMDAALTQARKQNHDQVRLVQSPSHIRSFVLYTKSGFTLREPLFLMEGQPLQRGNTTSSAKVHLVSDYNRISMCNELCKSVYGFSREMELREAKDQGVATMIEQAGVITGYAAGIGIFGHAVAKSNEELKALISKEAPTNLTSKTPKDLPPTVSNLTFPINLTKPVKVQFKATDPDKNDTFTFDILRFPAHGKLGNISRDNISYTPNATFFFDNFTYRARDKAGLYSTNNGTVILDHPPTVSDQTISVNGTIPVRVQLAGSDPDQGDKLTFSLVQRPLNAVLSDPSGNLSTYYPNPGFIGQDKFIYRANDRAGLSSNNGTVSINVGKPLPTINPNATGLTAPFLGLPASYYPLLSTVLVYAAIVALFMFFPLVYDMRKAYGQKGKPSGESTGFPDLARSLMAFGIIIILAILAFHVLATVTYNVLPSTTNNALVEIIKNLIA